MAPLPPPPPSTPRTPPPRRAETVHSAGGVGSTLKTTDAALVIYLADAWAARAVLGGRRKLEVTPWTTVRETKALVAKLLKIPPQRQRLFWRSTELVDARTLEESGVHKSGETLLFDVSHQASRESPTLEPVSCAAIHEAEGALPPPLGKALLKARRGLVVGRRKPELALDGTGGTYFLAGLDGVYAGCFKPSDEETFCENNPRLFAGDSSALRRGVRPGEAHAREVAAYLLDARSGSLAGVPATTLATSSHKNYAYADRRVVEKIGSFQVYVPHDGVAEDFAPSTFDVARLQAIAALDVRCLNSDRNAANLLVPSNKKKDIRLVPIDHGFCLPEVLSIEWFDWCWIDWKAISEPVDPRVKASILALDAEKDATALRDALGLRPKSLRLLIAATKLLQKGVRAGLTIRDVAELVVKPDDSSSAPGGKAAATKGRLAVCVTRANDLADLAVKEGRSRGARPRFVGRVVSPPASPGKDEDLIRAAVAVKAAALPASEPIRITTSGAWGQAWPKPPARSESPSSPKGSPRWVDGPPSSVLERPRGVPASPMASRLLSSSSGDDSDPRGSPSSASSPPQVTPPSERIDEQPRRFSAPPLPDVEARPRTDSTVGELPRPTPRRTRGSPLVRLHSCPSLAEAVSVKLVDRKEGQPLWRNRSRGEYLDGAALRRLRSHDEVEHDAHFAHYLDGLLDDLVAWKKRRVDYPALSTTA